MSKSLELKLAKIRTALDSELSFYSERLRSFVEHCDSVAPFDGATYRSEYEHAMCIIDKLHELKNELQK